MTEPVKEGPSNRALKQLNNRNNLAGLKLRKTLEQFDREKSFSISVLDRDKFDTRDFLRTVKYCDSDYLPQSRNFLGSPDTRRRRIQTAKTAPCRMNREHHNHHNHNGITTHNNGTHTDASDDETFLDDGIAPETSENCAYAAHEGGGVRRAPLMMTGSKLLASRKTASAHFKLNEYQRAEKFLRRLREQVAVEELQSHYTDEDYTQFLNAVVSKISRNITPSLGAPSLTNPQGPTMCPMKRETVIKEEQERGDGGSQQQTARFDMVYPIRLLGNIETKHEASKLRTPSPSLGFGSPGIRATPLGIPEGGAVGLGSRLVVTAPQANHTKPWTPSAFSLDALRAKTQSELDFCMMRAMMRSGLVRRKPLNQRVHDFCKELDEIRSRNSQRSLPAAQSVDKNQKEERRKSARGGGVGYSVG